MNEDKNLEDEVPLEVDKEVKKFVNIDSNNSNRSKTRKWTNLLKKGYLARRVLKFGIPSARPRIGDVCVITYTGRLKDGTIVDRAVDFKIHYSYNEVIQGLDIAIGHMTIGEEDELEIGPSFAYGALGRAPDVPPGQTLKYDLTLVNVYREPPIIDMDLNERIKHGEQMKRRGHWWHSRHEYTNAVNCYSKALEYLCLRGLPRTKNNAEVQKLLLERSDTYNHLAASQIKMNAFDSALEALDNVLGAQPDNVKALLRKSMILREKGELSDSLKTVKKALSYEGNQSHQREYSLLSATQRKVSLRQRELFRNIIRNA